jgi:hypothetical protein
MPRKIQTPIYRLDEFDFPRLAACYKFLRWRWRRTGIPNVGSLIANADYLCERAETFTKVGTGGMTIVRLEAGFRIQLDRQLQAQYETAPQGASQ